VVAAVPGRRDGTDRSDAIERIVAWSLGEDARSVTELADIAALPHGTRVDAVRSGDDLFPELAYDGTLFGVLRLARVSLRPGGALVAAVPELAELGRLRPKAPAPKVFGRGQDRQMCVHLWEWADDGRSYQLDLLRLRHADGHWSVAETVTTRHWVLDPDEVHDLLRRAGFVRVRRLEPAESGHPLPVWVASAP
jgi:hypothetical protein